MYTRRFITMIGAQALAGALFLTPSPILGQARPPAAPAKDVKKAWTAPRMADGHPDLQGVWTTSTLTPLERPAEFGDKAFLTAAEAAEYEKRMAEYEKHELGSKGRDGDLVPYNDFWTERNNKVVGSRRTSLIVDPPDGKIPRLTQEAKQTMEARAKYLKEHPLDGPEDLDLSMRCITRGLPQIPAAYNNNHQIVQAPGSVAILSERIHDARVIPLDGRPHPQAAMRQWKGDSRGRWEGDTLVVDTTNFALTGVYSRFDALSGSDESLHVIERFTRVDADTLLYQFTVDDPTAYTRQWSAKIPMTRTDDQMFEFACHEENYGMAHILSGARAEERAAAGESAKKP